MLYLSGLLFTAAISVLLNGEYKPFPQIGELVPYLRSLEYSTLSAIMVQNEMLQRYIQYIY